MSIAYDRRVSPVDMQDGRRRAWRVGPDRFEVISRDGTERYRVDVMGGMPLCSCTAARFGRPCWHVSLVLARLERADGAEQAPVAVPACAVPADPFEGLA